MKNVKLVAALVFVLCIGGGVLFSFLLGSHGQDAFGQEAGDIGYLTEYGETDEVMFDLAFDTTFTARVNITSPEEVGYIYSAVNIYEYGERVAHHLIASWSFDEQFPFESSELSLAAGGLKVEGEDEGLLWSTVMHGKHETGTYSLKSSLDLREEGSFQVWNSNYSAPVNEGEPVIYGYGVVEGNMSLYSHLPNRDRFFEWAKDQEKVITFEIMITSDEIEMGNWE
ncbi:hypothetical protein JSY36_06670 [Bacillus sp. H-16]|uniref:hypothetical protein n=1 Tax=Alteribacter salitolerans TaxID=2912333 RepID=UPI00196304AC|nr:hypothetical protein [Alteribacter salitolerans]MBM7095429.1 hypothetical protein [Alteribacter salitolerans]